MATQINVMAPLFVGDPAKPDPNDAQSSQAWNEFKSHLAAVKKMGVHAVSTDVWWGVVEKSERKYDWSYYDRLANEIINAGLKWIPIMSLHRCGGNVGDTVTINLPSWIWRKLSAKLPNGKEQDVQYVSEQGNASNEFVSAWATSLALDDYRAFFEAFQKRYADKAAHLAEINVSLGPAGELRYPSYNSHDRNTGYPTRGALQCYSRLALESFETYVLKKYGDKNGVRTAWGVLDKIEPPVNVTSFFAAQLHVSSQYGRDFFDWYQESLINHGRALLGVALEVFSAPGAAFEKVDVGAKFPGVHWRTGYWSGNTMVMGDRLAELTCGLINTSAGDWSDDSVGRGYRPLVSLFKEMQKKAKNSRVVLHFTCLEKPDGDDGRTADSLAFQLVRWVGGEAMRQNVPAKGENALAGALTMRDSWHRMRMAIHLPGRQGLYEGLTILRMADVVTDPSARHELELTVLLTNMPPPTPATQAVQGAQKSPEDKKAA